MVDAQLHPLVKRASVESTERACEMELLIDFLVPDDKVDMWRKTVKQVMEDLTWLNRWGIDLTVPVLIDITTGPYWGQLT